MLFRHAYSESVRDSDLECNDPSLAQQSYKDDVDINVLLERFKVTGQMPQSVVLPTYGDFSAVVDFRTANDAINRARNAFMDLPADLRARFSNDPQVFLEFCSNPDNKDELVKLKLANPPDVPVPVVPVPGVSGGVPPDVAPPGA